jgi:hypothetical protein
MADWNTARAVADDLSETGIDPLDVQAAQAAMMLRVRKFVFDLLMIFGIVALLGAIVLMFIRAFDGDDPIGGREIFIASGALLFLLIVVALRTMIATGARAYEAAWTTYVERVWPGTRKGDDFGTARLAFARRMASDPTGEFPSVAPGRKA